MNVSNNSVPYEALLFVSFGGPESREDVMPFLENVLRGRNVPRARMLEVAEHYYHFDGISPINAQNRALILALGAELTRRALDLPIYWGNRNWHPLLTDTMREMQRDGIGRALAFVTSAFGSYSGCRQYREDIAAARAELGRVAPQVDKIRVFYNHPGFIAAVADRVREAMSRIGEARQASIELVFTAHSIPLAMAEGAPYEQQLREACRLVAQAVGRSQWQLVYQSRSGPPSQPWLEPDICDYLRRLADRAEASSVVIVPIGFLSDHMEVLFDLDTEARGLCQHLGIPMQRAATVGTHPQFVAAIGQLIQERLILDEQPAATGRFAAWPDECPADCCPAGRRSKPASADRA